MVADGLFLERGYFFVIPKVDLRPLRELFRAHVQKMLKKKGMIDDAFIKMLMGWQHVSGFNIHNQVRIKPKDEKKLENLSQYIIRNAFSLENLKYYENSKSVLYHSKMTHGKNKKNFQIFSLLEFIAAITQHIPEQSFLLVRYYGLYSNRMQGYRKMDQKLVEKDSDQGIADNVAINIKGYKPKRIPQLMQRECIKKLWEIDLLTCPKFAGEMRIISFIYQRQVIRKILEHLEIYEDRPQRAPSQKKESIRVIELVPFDDGWPGFEKPANGCVCQKQAIQVVTIR